MQECDWTGTAAAVTALALTAGVWLWPADEAPRDTASALSHQQAVAEQRAHAEDMARWRAEARRWDGSADQVQLSSAGTTAEISTPVLR